MSYPGSCFVRWIAASNLILAFPPRQDDEDAGVRAAVLGPD